MLKTFTDLFYKYTGDSESKTSCEGGGTGTTEAIIPTGIIIWGYNFYGYVLCFFIIYLLNIKKEIKV